MQLYMQTDYESEWAQRQWQQISAVWEKNGHLNLNASMEQADAILITLADPKGSYPEVIQSIAASTAYTKYPDKCFVFDTQDSPIGLYPGLYCSLRRHLFSKARHRTGCYLQSFNEFIYHEDSDIPVPCYLFSFQGNLTSKTRGKLFSMDYARDDVLVERTKPFWTDTGSAEYRHFKQQYADNILRSKFVLCPRGIGTSSFRLFETMQSGRVPIILSDAWVPSPWIDWSKCSLQVRECDIQKLPEICLANEDRWKSMARQARHTWEEWFSPVGMGQLVRTSIQDIIKARRFSERTYRLDWPIRSAVVNLRQALVRTISKLQNLA